MKNSLTIGQGNQYEQVSGIVPFGGHQDGADDSRPSRPHRNSLTCDDSACGHKAAEHYDPNRGYTACNVEGCPCHWFSKDQIIWEMSR